MANYIAHYTKKKARLLRLEQQLSRSVRTGTQIEEQLQLAEEVRLARIRALRATQATFRPAAGAQPNRGASLEEQIALLEKMTSEGILTSFVEENAKMIP